MKTLGTICGIGIWVGLMWPVLKALDWNPWTAPFTGLVVAGAYLLVSTIASHLATIAGALDVKSRAEHRLSPEQAAEGVRSILSVVKDEQKPAAK